MKLENGFSLIELMVGVALGLLSTLVITQTFKSSEANKRTTTSGVDGQTAAMMALFSIERDAKMAGYGLTTSESALGCEIRMKNDADAATTLLTLSPVLITDGAAGAPDQIQFLSSTATAFSLPVNITIDHPKSAAQFFVDSSVGLYENDLVIAVPATPDATHWCTVFQMTKNGGGPSPKDQAQHNPSSVWNQPGNSLMPDDGYKVGDSLINLGNFMQKTYSVDAKYNLQTTDFQINTATSTTQSLYPHIMNLQAQYGLDNGTGGTANDGKVDEYSNTTPNSNAAWNQVLNIRVAMLVRNSQWEKSEVTPNPPAWSAATFNMSGITDWKHYRYRVLETTIPLRNMLWKI